MTERPQNKNLIPGGDPKNHFNGRTAVENGRKGARASAKKRRERKTLKETLELIGDLPMHEGKLLDLSKAKNIDQLINANKTVKDQIAVRLAVMAQNGNLRAIELIRDQIGERPKEEIALDVSGKVDIDSMNINQLLEAIKASKK